MLCVEIDELTPCLKDNLTGDLVNTEVLKVTRRSFLRKFNQKNGWYVNWEKLQKDGSEIFALVVEGSVDIQGLIALKPVEDYGAVLIDWMVAAPQNNKMFTEFPKYSGVGGHLFAIAVNKSCEHGFDGVVTGYAANEELVNHYIDKFGAELLGMLHPLQIVIGEESARMLKEVYNYEWSDDEL